MVPFFIDRYQLFDISLRAVKTIPPFKREYQFLKSKRWRVDFAWPNTKPRLAVEIEGGTWTNHSRHTRGSGYQKDLKKYNSLALNKFFLLRFTPQQIDSGEALDTIEAFFRV